MTTTIGGSYPAVNSDSDATINGLTVGKGGSAVSTNTAVGTSALSSNTSGDRSVAIGYQSATANTTGINTSVGYQSLYTNTTGTENTAVGFLALNKNTTGNYNAGLSDQALYNNTTGSYNVAVGMQSLAANTTASNNTAVGYQAGYTNATGANNTFVGFNAGKLATGASNTIIGAYAGTGLTTGGYNTFIGALDSTSSYSAGSQITTGTKNIIIGAYSGNNGGLDIRTASNIVVLSDGDGNPVIGYGILPNGSGAFGLNAGICTIGLGGTSNTNTGYLALNGSSGVGYGPGIEGYANGTGTWFVGAYSQANGGVTSYLTCKNTSAGVYLNGGSATSWTAVSDETRKVIIEPITGGLNKVATLRTVIGRLKTDEQNVRRPYLIAQDVQAVLPEAVSETEDKEGKVLGLSYTEVIPLLVNAIQELKAEFDAYKATHP